MPEGVVREADDRAIAEAAAFIRGGRLVAFPTETVYGLGADATNDSAVAAVFAVKDRPRFNPLIVHVLDQAAAERLGVFAAPGRALAAAFWPGPLTLVVRRQDRCPVSLLACAGLDTIALRAPAHPIAQGLLAASGRPIAAPSANRSGRVSPTTAQHVLEEMGDRVALILDDGPCTIGIESTVIDLSGPAPALLRPGAITAEQLAALVGPLAAPRAGAAPRSPGLLARHYAPRRPLRLDAAEVRPGEALLGFGSGPLAMTAQRNLSARADLGEAAANLFRMLRELDRPEHVAIAVMPVPEVGLGRAINDRLRRAAAR